ncbi:MAG: DUF933 domain-containing protein [Sedimentisphaerales bacterium]|jgi:GTP-binding protein YchF|nr:DUF933 domain-containing protein [Sedimentisphaerales bacterium]
MKVALIGPTQSGKSTLLAALTGRPVDHLMPAAINEGIVSVPDERIDWLAGQYKPKKVTYATIDCLDLPGLDLQTEHGRAAARRLISQIRSVDMIVLVVRAFEDASVAMYRGRIDPRTDLVELRTELLFSDLELVSNRIERLSKQVHKPTPTQAQDKQELALLQRLQQAIEADMPISSAIQSEADKRIMKTLSLLSLKPMAAVVNLGEGQVGGDLDLAGVCGPEVPVLQLCIKLEYELSQLDPASRSEFLEALGIDSPAINKFVKTCYQSLGLISFLTVGHEEVRAWPIPKGTVALDAAGRVHSDMKRGFIRAEVFRFEDLKALGSEKELRAAGRFRVEGKDYVIQDGDVVHFRFNV